MNNENMNRSDKAKVYKPLPKSKRLNNSVWVTKGGEGNLATPTMGCHSLVAKTCNCGGGGGAGGGW